MIDVRRLRTDLEPTIAALARKRVPEEEVRRAAALDSEHRQLAARSEELRSRVKALSKQVGDAMRTGDAAKAEAAREESKCAGEELAALERQGAVVEAQLRDAMLRLPNLPSEDAPDGASEKDNVVVRTVGFDPARYGPHQRTPHWEIGAELQILDLERGAKISGSMFPLFRGQGATLVRALCQLALDRNADAFTEVRPPTLVRTPVMEAVGQLPKFADDAYHLERDDLWAIPTAEVPLTSMRANEILADEELPAPPHGLHPVLPARSGGSRAGHPGAPAGARVRQGRDTRHLPARPGRRSPRRALGPRRGVGGRARPSLPDPRYLHRGSGAVPRPPVRRRGLCARLRHVAGGVIGLLVQRLPGPAGRHPLPARRRWRRPDSATP